MKIHSKLRVAFFTLAIAAISLPAFSQGGPGQGPGRGGPGGQRRQFTEDDVKNRVNRLAETLDMNEDQKKKITDYELEQFKKNQVEMQKLFGSGDREAIRSYMMAQREARNKKYEEVLTDDQFKKYQEIQRERMQNRPPPGGERPEQNSGERPARGRGN